MGGMGCDVIVGLDVEYKEWGVVGIELGSNHTCAILATGSVKCWGNNLWGQLGLGDEASQGDDLFEMGEDLPTVDLNTVQPVVGLAAGTDYTCALLPYGQIKCWGSSSYGQLGLGDTKVRGDDLNEMGVWLPVVDFGTAQSVVMIAAGGSHLCALLNSGAVKCWGNNTYGQLGLGDKNPRGDNPGEMGDNLPPLHLGIFPVASITAGLAHTCALSTDGRVKCWGRNNCGQLGQGHTNSYGDDSNDLLDMLPNVALGSGLRADAISSGYAHTCALLDNGRVKCWGHNEYGQLGGNDTANRGDHLNEMSDELPFVPLAPDDPVFELAAGGNHTCVLLKESGNVRCWGANNYGQQGDANADQGLVVHTADLGTERRAVHISAGSNHTCAIMDDRSLKCWGNNMYGQLGLGDDNRRGDNPNEMGDSLPSVKLFSALW